MELASIVYDSLTNGNGLRTVLFFQGCSVHCEGCFNKHTWEKGKGRIYSVDQVVKILKDNSLTHKVTLSGGNPVEQEDTLKLCQELKKENWNIWIYTGFTYEYCLEHYRDTLNHVDIVVDGKFEEDKKEDGLKFRGSSNQRIIDVQKSLKENKVVLWKEGNYDA